MSKKPPRTSAELWKRLQRIAVAAALHPGSESCNDYDAHAIALIDGFCARALGAAPEPGPATEAAAEHSCSERHWCFACARIFKRWNEQRTMEAAA